MICLAENPWATICANAGKDLPSISAANKSFILVHSGGKYGALGGKILRTIDSEYSLWKSTPFRNLISATVGTESRLLGEKHDWWEFTERQEIPDQGTGTGVIHNNLHDRKHRSNFNRGLFRRSIKCSTADNSTAAKERVVSWHLLSNLRKKTRC